MERLVDPKARLDHPTAGLTIPTVKLGFRAKEERESECHFWFGNFQSLAPLRCDISAYEGGTGFVGGEVVAAGGEKRDGIAVGVRELDFVGVVIVNLYDVANRPGAYPLLTKAVGDQPNSGIQFKRCFYGVSLPFAP